MSFGFSVGDFIAVGKLIVQITSALRESTGASAEYASFLLRLDLLEETLKIADLSIRGSQLLPQSAINAILKQLEQCSENLWKFNALIEKHRKSLSKGCSQNRVRDSWRKIGWSLFTREEIKEIDDALSRDVNAISTVLALCGIRAITEVAKRAQEHETILKAVESAIPASLRYAWDPDYKPVYFITALDQRLELPYELCYQWKTFRDIVNMLFVGRPGNKWVNNGFYEIIDENNRETVLGSKNWEDVIEPNMIISMNMLLRKQKTTRGPESASCPSCGDLYKGYPKSKDLERVRCKRCATSFQISSEPRITEAFGEEGDHIQHGTIGPLEKTHASSNDSVMDEEGEFTKYFRRWHIIWEENKVASWYTPQCLLEEQNLDNGIADRDSWPAAATNGSSSHSRRKPCTVRRVGKYACKVRGCSKEHIAIHFKSLRTRCSSCSNVYYHPRSCGIHYRRVHLSPMATSSEGSWISTAGSDALEDQEALAAEYIFGHREWIEDP